jgi:hypothetical protein
MADSELPRSLIEELRTHRVIPFAGAGVSVAARLKRDNAPAFPSWTGLLQKAAVSLREEMKPADAKYVEAVLGVDPPEVLNAARRAKEALHTSLWSRLLVECFALKKGAVEPGSLALGRAIWRLGSPLVITTNYDNVLHWAAPPDLIRSAGPSRTGTVWLSFAEARTSSLRSGISTVTSTILSGSS